MKDKKLLLTSIVFLGLFFVFVLAVFSPAREVFMPFITMLALVYFLSPWVGFLRKKGVKAPIATLLVYVFIILIILFGIFIAIPAINEAVKEIIDIFNKYISPFLENKTKILSDSAKGAYSTAIGAFKTIMALFVGAVAAFYYLSGGKAVEFALKEFVPVGLMPYFKILVDDVKASLDSFFKGQIIIAFILFIIDSLFLYVMKIPYAIGLGAIAAILDIIPYAGAFVGIGVILTVTLLNAPKKFLIILIGLLIIQQIENNVISPKVSSDTLKLHPSVTVLVLYLGAFGGFWGILLAVPLASIFCRIMRRLIQALV